MWLAFLMISVGVVCTVFDNPHFNATGFSFCFGSAAMAAVQLTLSETSMTQGVKLDPVCVCVTFCVGMRVRVRACVWECVSVNVCV